MTFYGGRELIYVIGFSYPVVPKGEARIRVQISAAHTKNDLDIAIAAFKKIGLKYNLIDWVGYWKARTATKWS